MSARLMPNKCNEINDACRAGYLYNYLNFILYALHIPALAGQLHGSA